MHGPVAAKEMEGKVKIVKIDVDQNPGITQQYRIQAMPTLMMFKAGKVAATQVGRHDRKSPGVTPGSYDGTTPPSSRLARPARKSPIVCTGAW
jgi:thiol-disulfide isomerase/thioredoxin